MSYTDPDAASTTMLVWRLAQLLDAVDEGVALCAYTGLMTDTGGFRFQNANAAAFQTASEMIAAGADPSLAATQAFCNRSRASLSLEALAIERASFSDDGTIAVSWLALDDFARLGAAKADASPVVNALRSIRGVRVAAVLREQEHSVRVSVRSKDGTDVSRVARLHDGGGHKGAAGFTLYGALDEACSLVAVELGADVAAQDAERGA